MAYLAIRVFLLEWWPHEASFPSDIMHITLHLPAKHRAAWAVTAATSRAFFLSSDSDFFLTPLPCCSSSCSHSAVLCCPTCLPPQTLPTALGETTWDSKAEHRGYPEVPVKYRCSPSTGVQPPGTKAPWRPQATLHLVVPTLRDLTAPYL